VRMFILGLVILLGIPGVALAQVSASASARVSAGEPAEVTIGVFTFRAGEKVAFELSQEESCICMCEDLLIKAFYVLGPEGERIYEDNSFDYPVLAKEWVGRWDLTGPEDEPVTPGQYTAVIETSVGIFRAQLEVPSPSAMETYGRSLAKASVCGISLSVYKFLDESDNGATVYLRTDEKLLVALEGNPTTGYTWKPTEVPEFLAQIEGTEYLAASALVGGGGTFFFRYEAREPGTGPLSFAYLRPWEEEAAETFTVTVVVR